jgi:hypothetical protein
MNSTGQPKVAFGTSTLRQYNYENPSTNLGTVLRKGTTRYNRNTRGAVSQSKNFNKAKVYAPLNKPLGHQNRRLIKQNAMATGEIRYRGVETPEEYAARISEEVGTAPPGMFKRFCNALGECFSFSQTKKNRRRKSNIRKTRRY